MARIKYFSYYGCQDPSRRRDNSLAADTKIDYIIEVLNRIGYDVDHISPAPASTSNFQTGFVEHRKCNSFRYFSSFRKGGRLLRAINYRFINLQLVLWCLFNIKRGEQILVYHSLGYDSLFIKLKKLKSIRIIGEIEEIYQDVAKQKPNQERNEFRFFDICDKYIFPTHLLNKKLNPCGKPYVLIYGIYTVEPLRNVKWSDDDIHVIYAGTFDPNKGGAIAAVTSAAFLPKEYHVHICGSGRENEKETIIKTIEEINASSEATVTYDGLLKGEDFILFLQKCHIGLSTQNPNAAFNATSFPSKILTYLANGLRVVSIRIPVVEQSGVSQCISYYNDQSPNVIADAIRYACEKNIADPVTTLHQLDEQFEKEMLNLLSIKHNEKNTTAF